MTSHLPFREPHLVRDYQHAIDNYRAICGVRGYCGPFINAEFYNAFPDATWHGYGECVVCCSTCLIAREEEKRQQAEPSAGASLPDSSQGG